MALQAQKVRYGHISKYFHGMNPKIGTRINSDVQSYQISDVSAIISRGD